MKRGFVASVVLLAASSAPVGAQGQFVFSVPAGWTDLSPGAPAANFEGVPQAILDDVRSPKYAAIAFDFREQDGYYENFNAVSKRETLVFSSLPEVRAEFEAAYKKELGDAVRFLEAEFVTIQGVQVFRLVFDYDHPNVAMRQMQYVMPGGPQFAIVTYSATRESFDHYRPVFEESAQKTQGLREPPASQKTALAIENISTKLGSVFLVVLIVGLVVAKSLKKSPPARMPPRRGGPPRPLSAARRPPGRR
jgi:hypothetical protein